MGKLYEINQELNSLFCFEWDEDHEAWVYPDTGEFFSDEEFQKRMTELHMDKHAILEWMAKDMLNNSAEMESLKAEIQRLTARKKHLEDRVERFRTIWNGNALARRLIWELLHSRIGNLMQWYGTRRMPRTLSVGLKNTDMMTA